MTKEECTKGNIIKYLQEYYKDNNKIPISRDKEHPFSYKTVSNKFGSWSNALIEANIPLKYNKSQEVKCNQCNKLFIKLFNQIKKSGNHFCSRSCSGTYTNINRKTGNRISKLELFLQENLLGYYFEYNNRKICDGLELDIYIPKLKLAFEISGIVHYKPIYGEEKFKSIIEKDKLKMNRCIDKDIKLIIIKDESQHFTEKYGNEILSRIYKDIHKLDFKKCLEIIILFEPRTENYT
jgi:hypothetical protein